MIWLIVKDELHTVSPQMQKILLSDSQIVVIIMLVKEERKIKKLNKDLQMITVSYKTKPHFKSNGVLQG